MLLFAFRDPAGRWHGDPDTPILDGDEPGRGILRYQPTAGGSSASYGGQRLPVLYGPCDLERSHVEVILEDGGHIALTCHVLELLEAGPAPFDEPDEPQPPDPAPLFTAHQRRPDATQRPRLLPRAGGSRGWTAQEDELCRDLWRAGNPPQAIAALLGRSVRAVRFRLAKLGLEDFPCDLLPEPAPKAATGPARLATADSYRARVQEQYANAYSPWTPEEEAIVTRMHEQGRGTGEIAAVLGRQPSAVEGRKYRLGLRPPLVSLLPPWDDNDNGDADEDDGAPPRPQPSRIL